MICISFDAKQQRLQVTGHAGYAPKGQDIVCASVSALLYALLANLPDGEDADIYWADGNVQVQMGGKQALDAFCYCLRGLRVIANSYPDYVQMEGGGVGEIER